MATWRNGCSRLQIAPAGDTITAPAPQAGDANARREYRGGGLEDYARTAAPRGVIWAKASPDTASDAIGLRVLLARLSRPKVKIG